MTFLLQIATLYVPLLNRMFHTAPLSIGELASCIALSLTSLLRSNGKAADSARAALSGGSVASAPMICTLIGPASVKAGSRRALVAISQALPASGPSARSSGRDARTRKDGLGVRKPAGINADASCTCCGHERLL